MRRHKISECSDAVFVPCALSLGRLVAVEKEKGVGLLAALAELTKMRAFQASGLSRRPSFTVADHPPMNGNILGHSSPAICIAFITIGALDPAFVTA